MWASGDPEPSVMYLGQWLERWLALRLPIVRPSTRRHYRQHVTRCGALLLMPLADVTSDHLQAVANELLGRYAWNTVNNWRSIISTALKAAVPRYIPHNPITGVSLGKPPERIPASWRAEEVAQLVEAARGRKHECWLWTMLGTGIRLGESRALRREDIDIQDRTARVSRSIDSITNVEGPTKSGKARTVDLPDELVPMLVEHLARLPASEKRVFGSRPNGDAIVARAFEEWLQTIVCKAGARKLPLHSLRHTFATLSLEAGVPLKEVSEALGHANIGITSTVYSHAVETRRRRAANAMGKVLSSAPIRALGAQNGAQNHG